MTSGNQRLLFLHTPKTAGHWVVRAMRMAGVETSREGPSLTIHANLRQVDRRGRFTFAFVREPFAWYRSWWGWFNRDPENSQRARSQGHTLAPISAAPFIEFLGVAIDRHPGFVTKMYGGYVGPPRSPIEFIGRYERLADDLVLALRAAGEPFDEATLRSVEPVNVSGARPYCPADLLHHLIAAERPTYERFYPLLLERPALALEEPIGPGADPSRPPH